MRLRAPFAFGGVLIIALSGLIGFAAFSTDAAPVPTTMISADLPQTASGRVAAAAFVAILRGDVPAATPQADPAETSAPPPSSQPPPQPASPTTKAAAPTTTSPPPELSPGAPPTTTTAPPASTTTTAPVTTTTTPPVTTTTAPGGGTHEAEDWRSLIETYFPAERVDEAMAVMDCESQGDPLALNEASGAAGLFQFMPDTWTWASAEAGWAGAEIFAPEPNTAVAAWLVQVSIDTGHEGGPWGHWSCQP